MVDFFGAPIPGSYFLDLRGYDPAKVAAGLKIPILVLQGGHDYQVTNADYEIWQKALAGDPRATFKFYPNYTHLFTPGAGSGPPSPDDYARCRQRFGRCDHRHREVGEGQRRCALVVHPPPDWCSGDV